MADRGRQCEDDRCPKLSAPVWYCVDCDTSYCEDCWDLQAPHKAGKVYKNILHPPSHLETLRQMHDEDTETLWFGVTKDDGGHTSFEDHGRYAALMADSPSISGARSTKYPRLVSFVGVTNAGKSTIIKMLIDRPSNSEIPFIDYVQYPSPVVGSAINDKVPTSGDVHLYADPSTFTTEHPVLFADCEGMEGGEALPYGSQSRKRSNSGSRSTKKKHHRGHNSHQRDILWAIDETTRKREYAVTELYPRLLYTFSDVVVFVLRNAKVFQSAVLKKLLDWGAASLEKSLNQPTLPHAVIVVNATEMGGDQAEWDPVVATDRLLNTVRNSLDRVSGVPELRALADQWFYERGIEIRSVRDLILKYYSSFTVVRIPVKGRYTLMDKQARRLHDVIKETCEESYLNKRRARMASNADDLNLYLQAAFDHFTSGLDRPFNFIEVSLKNNPLPETFADHILHLALTIHEKYKIESRASAQWIFDQVGRIVASCIMLDCVRYRKGTVEDLFESYVDFLELAFEDFCDLYWPCSYANAKGQRCTVVRARHDAKGHQNENGKIFGPGNYQSTFSVDTYMDEWIKAVRKDLLDLYEDLRKHEERGPSLRSVYHALEIHRRHLTKVFHGLDRMQRHRMISHATCFCCLTHSPEHSLPCGHILCTTCVKSYAKPVNNCSMVMEFCPLHFRDSRDKFAEPWRIWFKPDFAGIRILSLDGGGIRGIIELEVLRAIELAIGCDLPIQAFFDLIVGTSTGGIISLAVGVKQWNLQKCIHTFLELCHEAFTEREFSGWYGLEQLATLSHGSKYKTSPLRKALKKIFGESKLFGGTREQNPHYAVKVAVTSTSGTGRDALVLSNYSRNQEKTGHYEFVRFDNPEMELQIDEAAAATSAAPGYFKNFYSERNKRTFLDGALYNNNPVQVANTERRLLWPDVADSPPDLLLSIGTGTNADIGKELKDHSGNSDKDVNVRIPNIRKTLDTDGKEPERPGKTTLYKTFKALYTRFDNILDAELTWKSFKNNVPTYPWPNANVDPFPYIRLNPDLGCQPPPLDAKHDVHMLRERVINKLQSPPLKTDIQRVAHQLIASTFFFIKRLSPRETTEQTVFTGNICCRFENNSNDLRKLGEFFRLQAVLDFTPYFTIQEHKVSGVSKEVHITSQVIDTMINKAAFELQPSRVDIELSHSVATADITLALRDITTMGIVKYSISGFPRSFGVEDANKQTHIANSDVMKHRQAVRRRSKRHNLRAHISGTASPTSDHGDPTFRRSDEDLAKPSPHSINASLAESPYGTLSKQTSRDSEASLPNTGSYTTSRNAGGMAELPGDETPRTEYIAYSEDTDAQYNRDIEEAIRLSTLETGPGVQRRRTADSDEYQLALERSKRHFIK